jgi:RND family efflux transporter MFP subunit
MRTPSRKALGLAAAGLLAAALSACGGPRAQDVVVATAGPRTVIDHPGGGGVTSAGITVPVSVDFRDTVTDVAVHVGQSVHRGQAVVSFDPTPFQSQLASLQSKLGLIAAQAGNAQARLAAAQQAGDAALANALLNQIANYQGEEAVVQQQIQIAEGRTTQVTSPIDGVIGSVNVATGGVASPGQVLVTVLDLSRIVVTANLPFSSRPVLSQGAQADVSISQSPGASSPVLDLQGRVVQIAAAASGLGQSVQVTVDAANTPDRSVIPGEAAFVRITVTHHSPVVISKLAVLTPDLSPTVWVVDGDTVHPHQVQVGISDGTDVEVLQGLKAGDVCVIVGNQMLADGSRVRVTGTEA